MDGKISMLNVNKIFQTSILKTLYFNIKSFGIIGGSLPVLVSKNVKLKNIKGKIEILCDKKPGLVSIGYGTSSKKFIWENNWVIIFHGKANIAAGCKISNNGILSFGKSFAMHINSDIVCYESIEFGNNCLVSWECLFMDTDFHKIMKDGKCINGNKCIIVGDNVWFGCKCLILKGTEISDNIVVAAGNTLTKKYLKSHTIISGNGVLKENIDCIY